jgi:hypothetical protein
MAKAKKPPKILNRIVDRVLAYRLKPKTKQAEKRQERRNDANRDSPDPEGAPAMEAGVTDHVWSLEEIANLE